MKTVPSVYSLFINTIYLSPSTQVAGVTVFRLHKVFDYICIYVGVLKKQLLSTEHCMFF